MEFLYVMQLSFRVESPDQTSLEDWNQWQDEILFGEFVRDLWMSFGMS
jgi:hypothetical protein